MVIEQVEEGHKWAKTVFGAVFGGETCLTVSLVVWYICGDDQDYLIHSPCRTPALPVTWTLWPSELFRPCGLVVAI